MRGSRGRPGSGSGSSFPLLPSPGRSKQTRLRGRGTLQAQVSEEGQGTISPLTSDHWTGRRKPDGRWQADKGCAKRGRRQVVKAKQNQRPPPSMFLFLLGVALSLSMGPVSLLSGYPFSVAFPSLRGVRHSAGSGEEGNGPSPVADRAIEGENENGCRRSGRARSASLTVAWKLAISRRGAAEACVVRV